MPGQGPNTGDLPCASIYQPSQHPDGEAEGTPGDAVSPENALSGTQDRMKENNQHTQRRFNPEGNVYLKASLIVPYC